MVSSISTSLARFALAFFIITCVFGIVGMLISQSGYAMLNQFLSFSVLFPYMVSFYLATQHFIKKFNTTPQGKQRWLFSFGCLGIFWLYTFISVVIGTWVSDAQINVQELQAALSSPLFIMIFLPVILFFNLLLLFLGYAFLGKPAQIMLKHDQSN